MKTLQNATTQRLKATQSICKSYLEMRKLQMEQNLGGRIAELLNQLNMTQRELADKVHVT